MRNRMSAIIIVALLVLTGVASAQETTGTLTGRFVDTQGLAVPGATVTVTGPQGAKPFVSDAEGRFSAPFLTPGTVRRARGTAGLQGRGRQGRRRSASDRPPRSH